MMGPIKLICDKWLEENDLAEDDGDDKKDENFEEEEESNQKADNLKRKSQVGRKKQVRDNSQLDGISKFLLGKMFNTQLGKAQHRMS